MSNLQTVGVIAAIFLFGIAVNLNMIRLIYEIEQSIADEKRIKIRWMLLFNRHVPILFAVIFTAGILAFTFVQIGRNVADGQVKTLAYMGALFWGAGCLNTLVMGTLTELKRISLLRQAERRANDASGGS